MSSTPSVTFIAPFGLGAKTTVWARTLPLAQELARQGWRAAILVPPWDTPADAGKHWRVGGVEIVQVRLEGGLLAVVQRLLAASAQRQPQIVHIVKPRAHAGIVQWWLWQTRRLTQRGAAGPRPTILLDIDDWEQAWAPINRYGWLLARFLAWQEEWGLRHADGITAASRWLVERVRRYSPQTPVCYLPNGVAIPALAAPLRRDAHPAPQVLFFTRFVEVTPAWLADFWHALAQRIPDVHLLIAGTALTAGREALFQQQLAHTNPGTAERVHWLGYIQREQLGQLYASIDCAIFPADETPLLQAKCSVRLANTLLYGVPVVASAVGEQAAYGAAGAAMLVDPTASPAEFAASVVGLLQEPAEQQAMVRRARQRLASNYTWSNLGGQMANFYAHWLAPTVTTNG